MIHARVFQIDGTELPLTALGQQLYGGNGPGASSHEGKYLQPGESNEDIIALSKIFVMTNAGIFLVDVVGPGVKPRAGQKVAFRVEQ